MTWWQYLILANIYLALFYGFYALLFKRETFFQLNRVYLVSSAVLSFIIPLIQSDWVRNLFITQRINQTIYQLQPISIGNIQQQDTLQHYTIGQIIGFIYFAGIIILAGKLIMQLILVRRSLKDNQSDDAYSFFGTIKLSGKIADKDIIMAHEEVHAKQWHSADVLLIELVMIACWFNPIVYLYRKAVKHIHEFIADRNAIKSGTSKSEYALLLLSETFKTPAHQLVNPFFNHSLLKQRIMMLQKNNSKRRALLKYGLSAPLFALMLILSAATTRTNYVVQALNSKTQKVLDIVVDPAQKDNATNSGNEDNGQGAEILSPRTQASEPITEELKAPLHTANEDTTKAKGAVFTAVEHTAEFPGGLTAFSKYLGKSIRYPKDAPGPEKVIVQFIVEMDGSLSDIHVLRGKDPFAKEAIRVLEASPKWIPGTQNGKKVRQQYTVPISFSKPEQMGNVTRDTVKKLDEIRIVSMTGDTAGISKARSTVRIDTKNPEKQPLYIVDGKEVAGDALKSIAPDNIESINILKDADAVKTYGKKAKNGVVIVTTKEAKDK
ncbi:M56 family metallopeptidase [Mucilaginibacter sp. KACC 22063]|uniref:M56 family metallopeptidase n=1 Tax=Mucilaginibacter sp. KACC 22063 TaxID=3025666 RepID=UPI00236528BE|nr:M56 family metallopeptidase [Mucilaginibacter sp. KACC 22063]WDF56084.1 M56 family metallopeptidase [Mucilaginibacter sp. KACC 22063]